VPAHLWVESSCCCCCCCCCWEWWGCDRCTDTLTLTCIKSSLGHLRLSDDSDDDDDAGLCNDDNDEDDAGRGCCWWWWYSLSWWWSVAEVQVCCLSAERLRFIGAADASEPEDVLEPLLSKHAHIHTQTCNKVIVHLKRGVATLPCEILMSEKQRVLCAARVLLKDERSIFDEVVT